MIKSELLTIATQWGPLVYAVIAVGIFLEGEAVIYATMFFAFRRVLDIYICIPLIFGSVILTDVISYAIGYYGPIYLPRIANFYGNIVSPMDTRLRRLSFGMFLLSKFTYGFHRAVTIRAGMLRLSIPKLFKINFLTSTIWIVTITAAAYASWKSIAFVGKAIEHVEVFLFGGLIILLAGSHILSHFSKKKLLSNSEK